MEEDHNTDEPTEPDPTRPPGSAEAPDEHRRAQAVGARLAPIGARALALAGFASLVLSDAPTRTVSVSFH